MLQAEKVMRRVILINKKRYISAKYEGVDDKGKVLAKGVEIARRDNCGMVVKCMSGVVDAFLLQGDEPKALGTIDSTLRELLGGRTDLGDLVVSKAITKEEYVKTIPAHVAVAKRMQLRDPSYEAGPAERIPYIIVANGGRTIADRAEDPLWAINHQMPLDVTYYVENQLAGPVARILMWKYGSEQDKHCIEAAEQQLRALQEKGEAQSGEERTRVINAHKALVKSMAIMQKHVVERFFGPAALARYPHKVQNTSGRKGAIDSFFKRDAARSATASADIEDLQKQAAEAKTKCDKCRGYADEVEIKCVCKECINLYKRASIAVRIKNLQ